MTLAMLAEAAAQLGCPLSTEQLEQFERYRALLLEWNQRLNLTAIVEPDAIEALHFVDSLAGMTALPAAAGPRVVDVGSGAGLPGLALRLSRPDLRLTLLEATRKKVKFLQTVCADLGLADVEILNGRAEDVGQAAVTRESWDAALARALAPLTTLAELCLPLVRVGGSVVAWKKRDLGDELAAAGRAISILGGRRQRGILVDLPGLPPDRQLLSIVKERPTPARYPRPAGVPKLKPLGQG